ncbi:hypothetical protein [Xanthomonas arboricola]|uniref:hypothetical protein n=1 Tax=Xanthomonas arboricola TaxID=56448 RepID=UPI002DD61EF7|nr:hypothetical protein [Xanthomonas arboricola]
MVLVPAGKMQEGQTGLLISGIGFLLVAAPALATPFSVCAAKLLLMLTLSCLAAPAIWLCFWPKEGTEPMLQLRVAVLAFSALLIVQVLLAVVAMCTGLLIKLGFGLRFI